MGSPIKTKADAPESGKHTVAVTNQGVRCEAARGKSSLVPPRPVAKFDTLLLMFVGHVDSVWSLIVATEAGCSRRLGFAVCAVRGST